MGEGFQKRSITDIQVHCGPARTKTDYVLFRGAVDKLIPVICKMLEDYVDSIEIITRTKYSPNEATPDPEEATHKTEALCDIARECSLGETCDAWRKQSCLYYHKN